MKVRYQGEEVETAAETLAAFLAERGVDPERSVVEFCGEALVGADALARPLGDGGEVNVYHICAGG